MNCPRCGFKFSVLAVNADELPEFAPLLCEGCGQVSLLERGIPRVPAPSEIRAIKTSPAWRDFLEPVARLIREKKAQPPEPVDRSKQTLSDGSPVTPDYRELRPDGQQKGYVVLSAEERARGFVRPVRTTYRHVGVRPKYELRDLTDEEKAHYADCLYVKFECYPPNELFGHIGRFWTEAQLKSGCGGETTMGLSIAETYARDPKFYGATFCCQCRKHFPVAEFVWVGTDERVGS